MQRPTRRPGHLCCVTPLLLTLAVMGSALVSQPAEARGKPRLLILRTEGNAIKDADRTRLTTALLRSARRYKHYTSVASKVDLVEEMFAFECTEAGVACLAKIGKKYRANRVVYSEVVREGGGALTWSMRVVHVDRKRLSSSRVAQSTRQALPNLADTTKAASKGLLVLIGPVDLPTRATVKPAHVLVRLIGGGVALVYANDQLLGRTSITGLKKKLPPGTYKLRVVRAGYKEWSKTTVLAAGKTSEHMVELALQPVAKRKGPGDPAVVPMTKKWWFWPTVVTGVAVVAVTIWAVTQGDSAAEKGTVGFSIDSADAHKDPVFLAP
ncbi:MAG: PEGA domain-containing protein [Myxococcales bacterium]|nr:PEGA domain-containing protein [Myxococcales bacterium]